jgi:fructokinase
MPAAPCLLLLGEALVDRLPTGPVAAGAPLNAARHLRHLGCAPLLVSRIGTEDEAGRRVEAAMEDAALSRVGLQHDALHATGVVEVRMLPGGGHRFEIAADAAWDHLDRAAALAPLAAVQPQLLYFGTLAQRHPVSRAAIRAVLAACAAPRFLDLNLRDGVDERLAIESLELAHWLKVNDEELAQLLRWTGLADAPALIARFELQRLIVTRGAAGYASFDAAGRLDAQGEGEPIANLVDTVGAGDAFSACLLAAHLQGKAWGPALALANRFAAAICGQAGASPSDPAVFYPPWQAALAALPEIVR